MNITHCLYMLEYTIHEPRAARGACGEPMNPLVGTPPAELDEITEELLERYATPMRRCGNDKAPGLGLDFDEFMPALTVGSHPFVMRSSLSTDSAQSTNLSAALT